MELIKNYNLTGTVVIANDAGEREVYAAKELRYYLQLMIGNPVEAKRIESAEDDAVIVLGSARALYGEEIETFEDDELHWYIKGNKLFIDGGKRGLLYGVYDFLESLGCRFFAENCEKVPTFENLDLAETDKHDKPAFRSRDFYHYDLRNNPVFSTKCRANGDYPIPEKMGGSVRYGIFVHSFYRLLPYKTYFKDHPEWYDFHDGVRGHGENAGGSWDICLSNPEVIEMLIKNTREFLLAHPEAEVMSISQNDCPCECKCEKCLAVDAEEGYRSGLLLRAVNAVAEALEEEFPKVSFEMLVYTYARQLPKITRPRRNVSLRLCTIECCFFHPLRDRCAQEAHLPKLFMDDFADWGKTGAPISIWDYVTTFAHYNIPHPNWRVLQPNMQTFYENNARGMFAQGNVTKGGGADLEELRCYLITKLMWDPYLDQDAVIKEFTDYYYGAAGKYIREYIDTLCNCCEECNVHIGCYQVPHSDYLLGDYILKYREIIDRAYAAVKDDPVLAMRVSKIYLSLDYAAVHNQTVRDHNHVAKDINKLFSDMKTYGIEAYEESVHPQHTLYAMLRDKVRGKRAPDTLK